MRAFPLRRVPSLISRWVGAVLPLPAVLACCATLSASADEDPKPDPINARILAEGQEAGQERDDNGLKMKLVWCPPGRFKMGSPASEGWRQFNESQVDVLLRHGFWLGKYEVTQGEFLQLLEREPWKGQANIKEGNRFPASYVDWDDANEFCVKLTAQEQQSGRLSVDWEYALPTEAQWERACRAGTKTAFSFGEDPSVLGTHAWYAANTLRAEECYAHEVGLKKPNSWGLHDMHGNVWELCRDVYQHKLPGDVDPFVSAVGTDRVIRGGCWQYDPTRCRTALRVWSKPMSRFFHLGFRVALVPSGK